MPIQPIYLKIGPNWPIWQSCLAGSSKTAPRILIFSIVMGADYSFYVKSIATYAPAFLRHNNSVLARLCLFLKFSQNFSVVPYRAVLYNRRLRYSKLLELKLVTFVVKVLNFEGLDLDENYYQMKKNLKKNMPQLSFSH